jgi:hypothetical protein
MSSFNLQEVEKKYIEKTKERDGKSIGEENEEMRTWLNSKRKLNRDEKREREEKENLMKEILPHSDELTKNIFPSFLSHS